MARTGTTNHDISKFELGDHPAVDYPTQDVNYNWDTIDNLLWGKGNAFPATYAAGGVFFRLDQGIAYENIGTQATPAWDVRLRTTGESLYTSLEAEASTTSTSPVERLKLTTPALAAGDYKITWNFELSNTRDKDEYGGSRVQLDDTTTLSEMATPDKPRGFNSGSGFIKTALVAGTHTIDIDYWTYKGTASIRRCRIEIRRIY